jgi:hypothetical protein
MPRFKVASLVAMAIGFVSAQAGGIAQGQLTKALREAAAREAAEVQQATGVALDESVFNQWVFGIPNVTTSAAAERLESNLMLAVDDLDRAVTLTENQRRKLILAGHGDRKRFFDRVAEQYRHDPKGANEIVAFAEPLAADYALGLYGEGSFFAKTIATTLTPEQAARQRESLQEKLKFRYQAKVTLILASLDKRVGFTTDQQRRFTALILEETTPLRRPAGQDESSLVLFKIARLPENKVRPIFDDLQWSRLDKILKGARSPSFLDVERLRAEGQLD